MLGAKAKIIKRYHAKSKVGHAEIQIPNGDVDRVLELDLSVSGHKLRVAKWQSFNGSGSGSVRKCHKPSGAVGLSSRKAFSGLGTPTGDS